MRIFFILAMILNLLLLNNPMLAQNKAAQPNIIFLLTDDQRFDALGCMGNPDAITPNIDKLAEKSTIFLNNYNPTSICMGARAVIMTGMYEHKTGCNFSHGPLSRAKWQKSYPMLLKDAGYYVGFAGKFGYAVKDDPADNSNYHSNADLPIADFDWWKGWPGQGYYPTADNEYMVEYAAEYPHVTEALGAASIDFIKEAVQTGKPFCYSLSFKAPHDPSSPDPQYNHVYNGHTFNKPENWGENGSKHIPVHPKTGRQYQKLNGAYKADSYDKSLQKYHQLMYGVDVAVGMIISELESQGLMDNTIIVYTTDNGYYNGSHDFGGKVLVYEEGSRAPLIIYDPNSLIKGEKIDPLTGTHDLAPTLLDYAGVTIPDNMDGVSLKPLMEGSKTKVKDHQMINNVWGTNPSQCLAVLKDDFKYIYWYYDGRGLNAAEELYNLKDDPQEMNNLSRNVAYNAKLVEMRKLYDTYVEKWKNECSQVPENNYMEYGVLFDRHIPWKDKLAYVPQKKEPDQAMVDALLAAVDINYLDTTPIDTTPINVNDVLLYSVTSGNVVQGNNIMAKCNLDATIYLVPSTTPENLADIISNAVADTAATANIFATFSTDGIALGNYKLVAVSSNDILSKPSSLISIIDAANIPPTLSKVTTGIFIIGFELKAQSDKDATLYLVPDASYADASEIKAAADTSVQATANSLVTINSTNIAEGNYLLYAIDANDRISAPSALIKLQVNQSGNQDVNIINCELGNLTGSFGDATNTDLVHGDYIMTNAKWKDPRISLSSTAGSKGTITWYAQDGIGFIRNKGTQKLVVFVNGVKKDSVDKGCELLLNMTKQHNNQDTITIVNAAEKNNGFETLEWSNYSLENTDDIAPVLSEVTSGNLFVGDPINLVCNEDANVYLVPVSTNNTENEIVAAAVLTQFATEESEITLNTTLVESANYVVYAIDMAKNISEASNIITIVKLVPVAPVLSNVTVGTITEGDSIIATCDQDAMLYLVASETNKDTVSIISNAVVESKAVANKVDTLSTVDITAGNYVLYAINSDNLISEASPVIEIKEKVVPPTVPVLVNVTEGPITVGDSIIATCNQDARLYLVAAETNKDTVSIKSNAVVESKVVANQADTLSTLDITAGNYVLYAINSDNLISEASPVIEIKEKVVPPTAPILSSVTEGPITVGDSIIATCDQDAMLYLVPNGTASKVETIKDSAVLELLVTANEEAIFSTLGIAAGNYILYAVYADSIISEPSNIIAVDVAVSEPIIVFLYNVTTDSLTVGDTIVATCNTDAMLYLVPEGTENSLEIIKDSAVSELIITADEEAIFSTLGIAAGSYILYAVYADSIISEPSNVIAVDVAVSEPIIVFLYNVTTDSLTVGDTIVATCNTDAMLYLVPEGTENSLEIIKDSAVSELIITADKEVFFSTSGIAAGNYILYAVYADSIISEASSVIVISKVVEELITVLLYNVTSDSLTIGDTISAACNVDATLYLVPEGTENNISIIKNSSIIELAVKAEEVAFLSTAEIAAGNYILYAVYSDSIVSEASNIISVDIAVTEPIIVFLYNVTTDSLIVGDTILATCNVDATLYLVPSGTEGNIAAIKDRAVIEQTVRADEESGISTAEMHSGNYVLYAVYSDSIISEASNEIIIDIAIVEPIIVFIYNVTADSLKVGDTIFATCNVDATLYLVPFGTEANIEAIKDGAVIEQNVRADKESGISTAEILAGTYLLYAIYADSIISNVSEPIVLIPVSTTPVYININQENIMVNVYPNPAKDRIRVKFDIKTVSEVRINILELNGKLVSNLYQGSVSGAFNRAYDIDYPQGSYVLNVQIDRTSSSQLLIITQ